MSFQRIIIADIVVEKSLFSLQDFLVNETIYETNLTQSFRRLGILSPVIVYKNNNSNQFHLIDGKKRIDYAKENQLEVINATVLPEKTPITEILTLIFYDKRNEITQSMINQIQFIYFALSSGAPESWILEYFCIPLGLKPHSTFLRECECIYHLPGELKHFCHEKKFSFKQILHLASYPENILSQLISWMSILPFSASTLEEIASNLKDYLKGNNKTIHDFIGEPAIQEILQSPLSPREKTEKLRRLIYTKQFPILSEVNARIQKTVHALTLPEDIQILWDKTLENKEVDLRILVKDPEGWASLLKKLHATAIEHALSTILDEL